MILLTQNGQSWQARTEFRFRVRVRVRAKFSFSLGLKLGLRVEGDLQEVVCRYRTIEAEHV